MDFLNLPKLAARDPARAYWNQPPRLQDNAVVDAEAILPSGCRFALFKIKNLTARGFGLLQSKEGKY
eukprot:3685546-Amphidinium_carterae.1